MGQAMQWIFVSSALMAGGLWSFSPLLLTPCLFLPRGKYKELNGMGLNGCFRVRAIPALGQE